MLQYGRRKAIALDSVFYILGPLCMAFASHASILLIGRLLVGVGIGMSAVVAPAYLGEIAPAHMRGRIVESYEILLCFGMLASVAMDVAFGHLPHNWRWMVGSYTWLPFPCRDTIHAMQDLSSGYISHRFS